MGSDQTETNTSTKTSSGTSTNTNTNTGTGTKGDRSVSKTRQAEVAGNVKIQQLFLE